jgi:anion-transporting  ArsA/GET3 family ATPase
MTARRMPAIEALAAESSIVICCGSGGVGKTTTAAAIALEGAQRGRTAVVVTIDPARRLADALGLSGGLTDAPTEISGPWPGHLWAVMLDTKSTFDALVVRYATDPAQAQRILANRFYRNISGALSGTQEYMAAEKLYELRDGSAFDLVVVDTPPTRNALDFLDAPGRLVRFLDHRLYRALMTPTKAYLKAVGFAAQAFVRTVSKVVGGAVLADAIAFFQAFDGMEAGFRERAERVLQLLSAPETAYTLVTAPRRESIEEAEFFAQRLADSNRAVAALIVNRMHPSFGFGDATTARAEADRWADTPLGAMWANLADLRQVAGREEDELRGLAERVAPAPLVRVPVLRSDVHDLDGLAEVAGHIFGPRVAEGASGTGQ